MTIATIFPNRLSLILLLLPLIFTAIFRSVNATCQLSFEQNNKLYNYSLTTPIRNFPHGILSEDGFYKVAANGTVLWFQLCDAMIFNHDPPTCIDCKDCGGNSRCGMGCSALVANTVGGYPVCTTLGYSSSTIFELIDKKDPLKGITAKMSYRGPKLNCSLAVSIVCDTNGVQVPRTLELVGTCDYATQIHHPSGCAMIISSHGQGMGWFGTMMIIILCLFGVYLLGGAAYRYFSLGIRGIDIIPNLEFWASLPHTLQSMFLSLVRRFRGPSHGHRSSYSPVNF
ncbi:uncharacterized protein LOC107759797 isoform X1 [Nicotiana tabacum]|uniref:Uncharacterized protein LOC107759797 isoform X1 n=2 Tax=Nicotiana TaxID=4085 RepID=A0A1S3X071_TOBAC|nr:PREDICTED: uncharacterized protein LOC104226625 isoform X1 [Nicotiana sylvestris]XP_016433292.1 PREDICTED: uncharacterized protein LOC107759797 isoform X1 [Nicotiana tabacum]